MADNTPRAFLEYIRDSEFDYSSLRPWEIETLSHYLNKEKTMALQGYEWGASAEEWLKYCESTNDYCERHLIIAALIALEKDNPDEAKRRLLQLVGNNTSQLVDVPDHVEE